MAPKDVKWVQKFNQSLSAWQNDDPMISQHVAFLATVDKQGRPKVRTVGHADLKWSAEHFFYALLLGTDSRSPKTEQIKHNENVEVVYWFNETKEQYRISGKAFVVDKESSDALWLNERRRYFDTLLNIRKQAYQRDRAPGTPMDLEKSIHLQEDSEAQDRIALAHYALIVIECTEVDWLSQIQNRRVRYVYEPNPDDDDDADEWKAEELVI